jgi:hypothetical protein
MFNMCTTARCARYLLEKNANNIFGHEDQGSFSSSPHIGPEPASVTTAAIMRSGHLPMPQLGIIGEIEKAIKSLARTQAVKERICEYIQQEVSVILSFADLLLPTHQTIRQSCQS